MNLWNQIKNIPGGAKHLADWIGDGGHVVDRDEAQKRANICQTCALNVPGLAITSAVASAIKAQLSLKSKIRLRVDGEKKLHNCDACGCVLRLLVWEPQERVESHLTDEERQKLPEFCWKVSK